MSNAVTAEHGVAAAGHPAAAEAAVSILRDGGNAVDAVIAGAFVSFVVEPAMCGLGGHGRLSVHRAATGDVWGIDHFIVAPAAATPAGYDAARARLIAGNPHIPAALHTDAGPLSVGVPGAVAGLAEAQRRFAAFPLARLMAPAVAIAEAGVPVDTRLGLQVAAAHDTLRHFPLLAAWLRPRGRNPRPGERLDGTDLARTLKRIAVEGEAAVQQGPIAEAIGTAVAGTGGLVTAADLAAYRPRVGRQPLHAYRDVAYATCGDLVAVEALNILDVFSPDAAGQARTYHLLAEAMAQAFIDNFAYGGDPAYEALPLAGLASRDYARLLAAAIAPDRARDHVVAGEPWAFGAGSGPGAAPARGTTQICAMDRDGNVASLITSIDSPFGSFMLVPDTGILLGNGLQLFGLFPHGRNAMAPGRMPLYGAPVLVARRGGRALGGLVGAGGYRIASGILNTFVNLVDHGLPLAQAISAPRIHAEGAGLEVDEDLDPGVQAALAAMGHGVKVAPRTPLHWPFGRTSAVWRGDDGTLHAASGQACGAAAGY